MRSSGNSPSSTKKEKAAAIARTRQEAKIPPTDIAAIEGLKELERLAFYGERLINIDALAGLPKLKELLLPNSDVDTLGLSGKNQRHRKAQSPWK
jgi:hypothetical protein